MHSACVPGPNGDRARGVSLASPGLSCTHSSQLPAASFSRPGKPGSGCARSLLCNIPLDLPIDELVTWRQLAGDPRLSGALAECDARGWDALPLAPRALCPAPNWSCGDQKAAERWLAKNPQGHIEI